jgi:hypothetical protein
MHPAQRAFLEALPVEERLAGLSERDILAHIPVDKLLASIPLEQLLQRLAPEELERLRKLLLSRTDPEGPSSLK